MTSQINYDTIDTLFPVAGQDNDSQGFRDNFDAIKTALTVANSEVSKLQTNALLSANLSTNVAVENNLNGSGIVNGYYANFNGLFQSVTVSDTTYTATVSEFPEQLLNLTGDVTIRFSGWPASDKSSKVKLHLVSTANAYQVTFVEPAGTILYDINFPTPFVVDVNSANTVDVVEAWTSSNGSTVYLKYLGKFTSTPSNNQTINGSLSVTGNTVLGNATTDNITLSGIPKFPSLTTSDRNSLTASVGMVIFNTTTTKLQVCTVGGGSPTWADLN